MSSVVPQDPFNEYIGNGVTTVYPYEFQLLAAADLVVTIAGVVIPTSEFSVSGIGAQAGGSVTFTTAPANLAAILLSRDIALQRDIDYQYNGDFLETTVDLDFNRIWQAIQGAFAWLGGAIRAPFPEQIPALPSAANRANKILAFDADGDPVVTIPSSGSAADVLIQLAASSGGRLIGLDDADASAPDRTLQKRIHRDYVNVSDIGGADPTGTVDNTTQLMAAIARNKLIRLDGFFRHNISLSGFTIGIVGDGPRKSGLICNGVHAITLPSNLGLDRRRMRLENFAIDSVSNSCDDKFAIYAPGVAGGAAPVYNSGLYVGGLEIGRNGRMGGVAYLKDIFRVAMEDIGGTDVSWMIRLVGSVVQAKFSRITTNNDSAALAGVPTLVTSKYGVSTESATYAAGVMTPENIRVLDCAYIRGARGISHTSGLDVEFVNFDTEADAYGAFINAACAVRGGIMAPGIAATAWIGISRGVSISDPDDTTIIEGVDINCLRAPSTPASSYGLDVGNGVSPVFGLVVRDMRVRGLAGSLQSAIRARIMNGDGAFYSNRIRSSVCLGTEVDIQSGRTLVVEDNIVPSGIISVSDDGDTAAGGRIIDNVAATLTTSLSSDSWSVYNPGISGGNTRAVGEFRSTFIGSLTDCTTVPTGVLRYVLHGRIVTLFFPSILGTSNATAATITGLPAALVPNRQQDLWGSVTNNGTSGIGAYRVTTGGVIELYVGGNYAAFAAAGSKGTNPCTITYSLD